MHVDTIRQISHEHDFEGDSRDNEKRTLKVIVLTGITMCVEIIAGVLTGSMALLADGVHMGTHAFALGITYFAYVMARRFSGSTKFGFGTGKFGILSGYTSALFLGGTALYMIVESFRRFFKPVPIAFDEAILIAIVGLAVNVLSIWMLHGKETIITTTAMIMATITGTIIMIIIFGLHICMFSPML
jgi:cation diffusion facilitator family transporter